MNFGADRMWVLRLLYAGINAEDDGRIFIRNAVPEILLSVYTSPLSNNEEKGLILQVIRGCCIFLSLLFKFHNFLLCQQDFETAVLLTLKDGYILFKILLFAMMNNLGHVLFVGKFYFTNFNQLQFT